MIVWIYAYIYLLTIGGARRNSIAVLIVLGLLAVLLDKFLFLCLVLLVYMELHLQFLTFICSCLG